MASNLLNDRTIRSTIPQEVEIFLNDGDGLRLRIRPNGGRDWFYIYRRPGVLTPTKLMLGSYPTLKLADAREIATEYRKLRQQGLDPKVVREEAERKQAQAWASNPLPQTLSELFDYWSEHYLTRSNRDGRMRRKDGGAEITRAFKADVLPVLGNMRLPDIRKGHIAAILDEILSRGSNRMANQMLSNLRQLFRFAVSRDFMDIEPTAGLEKKDFGGHEAPRERVLSEAEIRLLSERLPAANMSSHSQAAIWLMLATACRVSELITAEWQELDFDAGEWTIPGHKAKNGREHIVHLSGFALGYFQALFDVRQSSRWVFPAQRKNDEPLCVKTLQKQIKDRQRLQQMKGRSKETSALLLPGGEWKTHDLRRTAATLMGELGIRPDVIDRCQNHVEVSKVTRTYQRQELLFERRQAFNRLGDHLVLLTTSDSNIPRLRNFQENKRGLLVETNSPPNSRAL